MKTPEYLKRQWHRLDDLISASPRLSGVSIGLENDLDPDAWCLIAHCIEVGATSVTVGLRIPEPHAPHVQTEVSGQTLAISVLKAGENPDTAMLTAFFRRAIHLPVPVTGSCSHHFEGPFLVVVVPRELENSDVTPSAAEQSTKMRKALKQKPIDEPRERQPRHLATRSRNTLASDKAARPAG